MNAWVVTEVAAGALAGTVALGAAVGRLLRGAREAREAAGEQPSGDDLQPLTPPPGYRPRTWLVDGARVLHPEHGLGTVVTAVVGVGWVGVRFDTGPGRWILPTDLDPITPADERTYRLMVARRHLNLPENVTREDH